MVCFAPGEWWRSPYRHGNQNGEAILLQSKTLLTRECPREAGFSKTHRPQSGPQIIFFSLGPT
jgi:hypothetical protein